MSWQPREERDRRARNGGPHVNIRLRPPLLARIDDYARRRSAGGVRVTRSDAIRWLLERGLKESSNEQRLYQPIGFARD